MLQEAALSISRVGPRTENKRVPSGTVLASLDPAIEFADELAESPTWRSNCRCLLPSLLSDTLSSRVVGRVLDRFGPRVAYVLCGCLYCLRC